MVQIDVLRGDNVVLRPFRREDAADVVVGCNDPLTRRYLPLLPDPYTEQDALWWINEGAPATFVNGGYAYGIADPATDRIIGGVGISRVHEGTGEIGYWVAPAGRRRGAATAATRTLAAHALAHGVQRLVLKTEAENTASQRVAIAAGFTRECVERGGGRGRDGSRHDLIVWARLATDSGDPVPRILPDLPNRSSTSRGELTDGVVCLRPLGPDDIPDVVEIRTLPDVVQTSVGLPDPDVIAKRCREAEASWLAGERADFTIRDAATGAFAGEIGLYYWGFRTSEAMTGYSMLPAWRGRGYATRAVRLLARWAFSHVGIARLVAGTAPWNEASQRVLARAGFQREGYERSRLPGPDGTRVDNLVWSLLPTDPIPD
ncbi:MAG TPA: GNAT family N-acetyltransferase [Micromonosporaceae bacterium]|nr:GNAT family N-acetyltransferase [Micromonosporaceae bacterium]